MAVAVNCVVRSLDSSNFSIGPTECNGVNQKSLLAWVECFFVEWTPAFNQMHGLVFNRLQELALARNVEAELVDADDVMWDDLIELAGLTAKDLSEVWHWCLDHLESESD